MCQIGSDVEIGWQDGRDKMFTFLPLGMLIHVCLSDYSYLRGDSSWRFCFKLHAFYHGISLSAQIIYCNSQVSCLYPEIGS